MRYLEGGCDLGPFLVPGERHFSGYAAKYTYKSWMDQITPKHATKG